MTDEDTPQSERLDELMVAHATEGLSPQDAAELSAAIAKDRALQAELDAYELAATAIDLSLTQTAVMEQLPAALREKLLADAAKHAPAAASASSASGLKLSGTERATGGGGKPATNTGRFSWTDGRAFGWYAAIAATIALCVVLVQPDPPATDNSPTLAEQYEALANDADTLRADWSHNPNGGDPAYADAEGEVIWNPDTQTGYMKLSGMPINDPTELQYQLWIVDPTRDDEPIDGGVFDITAQGEVIVPINAKLRSDSPAVFAITAEKPGGVVVSEGPLQVVAPVEKEG